MNPPPGNHPDDQVGNRSAAWSPGSSRDQHPWRWSGQLYGDTVHETQAVPGPWVVSDLLVVLTEHRVDHMLREFEQVMGKPRGDAEDAAAAKDVLRMTSVKALAPVVCLRAAPTGATVTTGMAR